NRVHNSQRIDAFIARMDESEKQADRQNRGELSQAGAEELEAVAMKQKFLSEGSKENAKDQKQYGEQRMFRGRCLRELSLPEHQRNEKDQGRKDESKAETCKQLPKRDSWGPVQAAIGEPAALEDADREKIGSGCGNEDGEYGCDQCSTERQ